MEVGEPSVLAAIASSMRSVRRGVRDSAASGTRGRGDGTSTSSEGSAHENGARTAEIGCAQRTEQRATRAWPGVHDEGGKRAQTRSASVLRTDKSWATLGAGCTIHLSCLSLRSSLLVVRSVVLCGMSVRALKVESRSSSCTASSVGSASTCGPSPSSPGHVPSGGEHEGMSAGRAAACSS